MVEQASKRPNRPAKYGHYLLSTRVISSLKSQEITPENLSSMTEAELLKIDGLGEQSVEEIIRMNEGGTPFPDTEDAPVEEGGTTQGPATAPSPAMSIVNLEDYEDPESLEGKELYIVALKPHNAKWLKLFGLEFCARRRIENLNYGLALEGVVRKAQSEYPMMEQAQAAEDSGVAQRV